MLACEEAISFSRRRDQTSEQASRRVKEHSWVQKKLVEKWGGGELEGEKVGRTGIAYSQSQTIYQNPSLHSTMGVIVHFDWLVACQSKSNVRNLLFMHNPTS